MNSELNHRSGQHRLAYLDALRGIAFLSVVVYHCALLLGNFPRRLLFRNGNLGVPLFFIISAVTLFSTYTHRHGSERFPVLSFYVRRLTRIAPLYWSAELGYNLLTYFRPSFEFPSPTPGELFQPRFFILNAAFLNAVHFSDFHSVVPGGWSIAMEMLFYAVFPLVFALVTDVRRAVIFAAAAAVFTAIFQALPGAALLAHRFNWPFSPPAQLFVFPVGILVYFLLHRPEIHRVVAQRFWAVSLLAAAAAAGLSFLSSHTDPLPTYFWEVIAIAGAVLALSGGALNFLLIKPLLHCGRISYSGYLLHFLMIGISLKLLGVRLGAQTPEWDVGSSLRNLTHFTMLVAATVVLTVAAATVTERLLERPCIALGKWLVRRLNQP